MMMLLYHHGARYQKRHRILLKLKNILQPPLCESATCQHRHHYYDEDVNFCKKAAKLGCQTYIYTKRILTHKERKMEEKAVATKHTESKNAFDIQQLNQLLGALQNAQDELTKSNAIITEFKRAAIDALNKQQKRIEELEAKNTKEKIDTNDN